uniref:Uncharacterized protein n=1 Tax=Candidatus Kentrum sp. LPFa TaxID=2126335 RepID=A0A450X4E3_9GAMM|nr:MAG: hypothetical protein BECKLPF1236B_GA0070989_13951 [Candidatus Kentron sp. LPFa]
MRETIEAHCRAQHSEAHSADWPKARQSGFAERRRPEPTILPGCVSSLGLNAAGDEGEVSDGVVGQDHEHAVVRSSRCGEEFRVGASKTAKSKARYSSYMTVGYSAKISLYFLRNQISAGSQPMSSRVW